MLLSYRLLYETLVTSIGPDCGIATASSELTSIKIKASSILISPDNSLDIQYSS